MLRGFTILVLALSVSACGGIGLGADAPVSTARPKDGVCRMLTPDDLQQTTDDTSPVSCASQHTAETFAVGAFPADVAGGDIDDPALGAYVLDECEREFRRFLGGDESLVMRATVTWAWFRPSPDAWEQGARWWRCDVVGGGEESTSLVTLPRTAKGILLGDPDDRWLACVKGPTVADSVKIPCSNEHNWRAVTTVVLGDGNDEYPGDRAVAVRTRNFCSDSVGAWMNYPVDYDYGFTWFHEDEWQAGNRRSICWAKTNR